MDSDPLFPTHGPAVPVVTHLDAALVCAQAELDCLSPSARLLVQAVALHVLGTRGRLTSEPALALALHGHAVALRNPWIRHGVEVELARTCLSRSRDSLSRWKDIEPVVSGFNPSERASRYIEEVTQTFLLGFDAACIAFCGATIEQLLQQSAVDKGLKTRQQIERDRPGARQLLELLNLQSSRDAAMKVLLDRNKVMHRGIWEARAIRRVAVLCIKALTEVLRELGEAPNSKADSK